MIRALVLISSSVGLLSSRSPNNSSAQAFLAFGNLFRLAKIIYGEITFAGQIKFATVARVGGIGRPDFTRTIEARSPGSPGATKAASIFGPKVRRVCFDQLFFLGFGQKA